MSRSERKAMVRRDVPGLSLSRQCALVSLSRSSFYYAAKGESSENLAQMQTYRTTESTIHYHDRSVYVVS